MTKLIYRNNISEKQNLGYIETKDTKGNDVFLLVNMTYFERISYESLNVKSTFLVDIYEIVKYWREEDEEGPIYVIADKKIIWQSRDLLNYSNFNEERSSVILSKATIRKCLKVMFDDMYEFGYNKTINQQIKDLVNG